jgi:hypothetical protein
MDAVQPGYLLVRSGRGHQSRQHLIAGTGIITSTAGRCYHPGPHTPRSRIIDLPSRS